MNSQALLEQFGVYFQRQFISDEDCRRLIKAIDSEESAAAGVYNEERGKHVNPDTRRVSEISGASEDFKWVGGLLDKLRSELSDHFGVRLGEREGPTFLRYEEGDFFLPHLDSDKSSEGSTRRVTAILFLNAKGDPEQDGGYEGADLSLFGLMSFPGSENHGFPVPSEPGLLVAFPSDTKHGVSELIRGKRYCAVCWYLAPHDGSRVGGARGSSGRSATV